MYGGSNNAAGAARQAEEERQQRINEGRRDIDSKFAPFDNNFYDQRAKDYESYALPQLATQERDTRNQLAAALARKGLLNSGAAIQGTAKLDQYANQKRQDVAMAGLGEANKLRSQVEDQRTTLTNQLISSGDPSAASSGAQVAAGNLKRPSAFGALGNFFSDWTDTYRANQQARAYDDKVPQMFSFGGNNKGSVSYVN
jgi:hypothetical protein